MKKLKSIIKDKLNLQDLEGIEDLILEYQEEFPEDLELISIKVIYFLIINNYEESLYWANHAVRRNPYNVEANYNLAYINEILEQYYESYISYRKTLLLAQRGENQEILDLNLDDKIEEILDRFVKKAHLEKDPGKLEVILEQVKTINEDVTCFGLKENVFKSDMNSIGNYYKDDSGNELYIGHYGRTTYYFPEPANLIDSKGEMRKILLKESRFQVDKSQEQILPILSETENAIMFKEGENEHILPMFNKNHFSYYRVKPNTQIFTEKPVLVGKPIPTEYDSTKRKLVLSLFVDGLSQVVINEIGFREMMPNTYKFFNKGLICKNVYSTADWTYPALASYMTGLDTTNHMMMHNTFNTSLPLDTTLLTEYLSSTGYATAKIDGDWRSTPNYGYSRGVDKVIYQHQWTGMRTQDAIGDAIEHMELMKDTNHYFWLGLGDLHDIADEANLQPSVEAKLSAKERVIEKGITSAKQPFSDNKRTAYIHQARMIDRYLGMLFGYIEENYNDDEIVVSLFSDHGQGYLVKDNEFFLDPKRTNVAFMFRGNSIEPNICEELISTADYSTIMCKLCNINMNNEVIDGRLPKIFGGKEAREYVITESIHPRDPYYASVYWKDYICNFKSIDLAGEDGRFSLEKGYDIEIVNYLGEKLDDEGKKGRNLEIIIEHIAGIIIYN